MSEAQAPQLLGQVGAGGLPGPTRLQAPGPDEHLPVQKGAAGDHHGVAGQHGAVQQLHPPQAPGALPPEQLSGHALAQPQVRGTLQQLPGGDAVLDLVGLGPGAPHRHAPALVEDAEVDPGGVDEAAHGPPQGVQLAHHVALADPPDAGIAAHLADLVEVHGEQGHGHAHAGSHMRGLKSRVPPADDDNLLQALLLGDQDTLRARIPPDGHGM